MMRTVPLLALGMCGCCCAGDIVIRSVSLVGRSTKHRLDPTAISFPASSADNAVAMCTANGTIFKTLNGGKSWTRCLKGCGVPENAIATGPGGRVLRAIVGPGVPSGYTAGEGAQGQPWKGPFASRSLEIFQYNRGQLNMTVSEDPADQVHWAAPPHPVVLFSPGSGGSAALDGSGQRFIATPWLWYGDAPLAQPAGKACCNGSVVAYVSDDSGKHWQFRSEIASKQTLNRMKLASEEGPKYVARFLA